MNLRNTAITALPASIATLTNLTLLALSNTKISSTPRRIGHPAQRSNSSTSRASSSKCRISSDRSPDGRTPDAAAGAAPDPVDGDDCGSSHTSPGQTSREKKLQVVRERIADRHGYWWDLTRIRYDEDYDEILWDIAPTLTDPIIVNMYRTGIRTLPRWLTRLPRLVGLLVHENRLVDLPDWLPELNRLERYDLSLNPGIVAVPDIVAALPSLRRLDLDDTGITRLPESMRTMTRLEQLTLSNTPLDIPAELDRRPAQPAPAAPDEHADTDPAGVHRPTRKPPDIAARSDSTDHIARFDTRTAEPACHPRWHGDTPRLI